MRSGEVAAMAAGAGGLLIAAWVAHAPTLVIALTASVFGALTLCSFLYALLEGP